LIEVLVASAIVVASIGVLLQIFASGLDRIHRSGNVAHRILIERQIVSDLKAINPVLQHSGEGIVEGWNYRWRADKLTEFRAMQISGSLTTKKAALFNINVDLIQGEELEHTFELLLLGWE